METRIHRRRKTRWPNLNTRKSIALSVVALCAVALSLRETRLAVETVGVKLYSTLTQPVTSRVSSLMKLDRVLWEEAAVTNLSDRISKDALLKVSGLKVGQEMLRIDLATIEKRLLSVPWIESVQIRKRLPSTIIIRYSLHQARSIGLKKGKPWIISPSGEWIAPVAQLGTDANALDLPLLVNSENIALELQWLSAIESHLREYIPNVHELNYVERADRVEALIELKYASQSHKLQLIGMSQPTEESIARLREVVRYLIKNTILVSTIDLRSGKKVVVKVQKRP